MRAVIVSAVAWQGLTSAVSDSGVEVVEVAQDDALPHRPRADLQAVHPKQVHRRLRDDRPTEDLRGTGGGHTPDPGPFLDGHRGDAVHLLAQSCPFEKPCDIRPLTAGRRPTDTGE